MSLNHVLVSITPEGKMYPPVKESGSVLFSWANICVIPKVLLEDDHGTFDVNDLLSKISMKQPFAKLPPHE